MTQQHPITPPPELVQQWLEETDTFRFLVKQVHQYIANRAAQWGADQAETNIERERQEAADQELEACLGEVSFLNSQALADRVRAARRPKPPSLKEEALQKSTSMTINCHWDGPPPSPHASVSDWFEQEGSKGVLHGLRISALPSRGGNRSPKPPSEKQQALKELDAAILRGDCFSTSPAKDIIRRALESIPDPS